MSWVYFRNSSLDTTVCLQLEDVGTIWAWNNSHEGSWRMRGMSLGVNETQLYFVFCHVLGEEFIPSVALNEDCRVGCLVFFFFLSVLIVGMACHLLLPEGGCTQPTT